MQDVKQSIGKLFVSASLGLYFAGVGAIAQTPVRKLEAFSLSGSVPLIAQEGPSDCWAAACAMLLSWNAGQGITEDEVVRYIANHWPADGQPSSVAKMKENGLSDVDKPIVLKLLGLQAEGPANYTLEGWLSLLKSYGPLWVTTLSNLTGGVPHAEVLVGIIPSGKEEQAKFVFIDTKDGIEHSEDFADFFKRYETVAINDIDADKDAGTMTDLRLQIIHLPDSK